MINRGLAVALFCLLALSASASRTKSQQNSLEGDVRDLYSANVKTRQEAAARLVSAGSEAIPLLKTVVCDRAKPKFDLAWPVAAKALGEMKAQAAVPCLVDLLMYDYPNALGAVVMKSDETLTHVDPAFAALVQIGEPAVPMIRRHLPFFGPEQALLAVRALHLINTPSAKEAADAYIKILEDQIRSVKVLMENPQPTPTDGTAKQ